MTAGPLIDFSPTTLPEWLWLWERDLSSIASFMADYIQTAVKRYCGRIRSWQLTAASNSAALLGLGEDEMLWLTVRMVEAARQVDPKLEIIIGIAQPWGVDASSHLESAPGVKDHERMRRFVEAAREAS